MNTEQIKIPAWFWVVSVVALLWNLMGVGSFISQMTISEEALNALPSDQQAMYTDYPMWANAVFAIAVFGGTIGSILLIMKKKLSRTLFIISLIAIVIQMSYYLIAMKPMDVYGPGAIAMPISIIVFGVFLVWLAGLAIKKGWLR
ncbi:MAG: hypothetical protein R2852_05735 [Bacteroidia bacterium]